jgi:hypothetical protein
MINDGSKGAAWLLKQVKNLGEGVVHDIAHSTKCIFFLGNVKIGIFYTKTTMW